MTESSKPGTTPVELAVTSDTECIPAVRRSCQQLASAIGFDAEQSKMIMLVMDEALSNVIKHGYQGVGGHPITVRMEHVMDGCRPGISITVRDRGRQVDPGTIQSRDLDDVRPASNLQCQSPSRRSIFDCNLLQRLTQLLRQRRLELPTRLLVVELGQHSARTPPDRPRRHPRWRPND